MKKFYLLASFLVAVFSKSLFAMQQSQDSKDSVVITIGTEVKDVEKNKGGIRNWFNKLSQNKKNALGVAAISGIALGMDFGKCLISGCEPDDRWMEAKIAAPVIALSLLIITREYRISHRALTGLLAWLGLSGICSATGLNLMTSGQASVYYFLFNPFLDMKS